MNKEYKLKLDLNKRLYNKKMAFNQFDENVNDFYIEVTKNNEIVKDLDKAIVTLVTIKPDSTVNAQFIEVKEGQIYADLKPSMCDLIGNYQAKAMIVLEGEIVITDTISYSVNEDKIISKLNDDIVSDERFIILNDMLSRLSAIEINEDNRKNSFSKIEEEFETIKNNHNEFVTTQTTKRVDEVIEPIADNKVKKYTEKVVNDLSNKVTEVDNKIEEVEEFVENKNSVISNIITNVNNKVDEAIAKIPPKSELIGPQGEKGDTPSIEHLEATVSNKVNEIETRFNTLTSAQQQDAEVIDAREGEISLKARLDRDIEKINNLEESVASEVVSESDFITVENTNSGYFSDIKLEGKTLILNADNEVVEAGTEGATLKSVGKDVDDITIVTTNAPIFFGKGGKK